MVPGYRSSSDSLLVWQGVGAPRLGSIHLLLGSFAEVLKDGRVTGI